MLKPTVNISIENIIKYLRWYDILEDDFITYINEYYITGIDITKNLYLNDIILTMLKSILFTGTVYKNKGRLNGIIHSNKIMEWESVDNKLLYLIIYRLHEDNSKHILLEIK
jgi:hypothetical protein